MQIAASALTADHVALWALGIAASIIGTLVLYIVQRMDKKLDTNSDQTHDTNLKVTKLEGVVPEVERLRVRVDKLGEDVAHLGGAEVLANKLVEGVTAIARASQAQPPKRKR